MMSSKLLIVLAAVSVVAVGSVVGIGLSMGLFGDTSIDNEKLYSEYGEGTKFVFNIDREKETGGNYDITYLVTSRTDDLMTAVQSYTIRGIDYSVNIEIIKENDSEYTVLFNDSPKISVTKSDKGWRIVDDDYYNRDQLYTNNSTYIQTMVFQYVMETLNTGRFPIGSGFGFFAHNYFPSNAGNQYLMIYRVDQEPNRPGNPDIRDPTVYINGINWKYFLTDDEQYYYHWLRNYSGTMFERSSIKLAGSSFDTIDISQHSTHMVYLENGLLRIYSYHVDSSWTEIIKLVEIVIK